MGTDPIADFELGDIGTNEFDYAGVIRAENERQRKFFLIFPEDLQVGGIVQADGLDSNSDRSGRNEVGDRVRS